MYKAIGIILSVVGILLSYFLLSKSSVNGDQFVTLTISTVILGFAICFLPDITEISIGGTILKLKQAKEEADSLLKTMHLALVDSYKLQLSFAKRLPGGIGRNCGKDPRIEDFWMIYNSITKAQINKECSDSIFDAATYIAKGQINAIGQFCEELHDVYGSPYSDGFELPSKSDLAAYVFKDSSVQSAAGRLRRDRDSVVSSLVEALEEYGRLIEIREKYLA